MIRAGYSAKSANPDGSRMLANASVSQAIAEAQAKIAQSHGVTLDWLIERYKRIADADIRKFYDASGNLKPIHELDDACATAIAGIETATIGEGEGALVTVRKMKRWDPIKALDSLGRHLGMFAADNTKDLNVTLSLEMLITASEEPITIEQKG